MASNEATEDRVGLAELISFIDERHHWVLNTTRRNGRPQSSPVTGGVTPAGRLLISTYPERDKVFNIGRNPDVTICVMSDHFGGAWVQVDGQAQIVELPDAMDDLIEYYQTVAGDHPDWDEYREAMVRQGKCIISVDIEHWGPIAKGGFPSRLSIGRFANPDN